jgi:glycosyltransferase involved in cell wall biosynthesis
MKIAMFTNTYTPHIGGVARSVSGLAQELRRMGHTVLVVAPEFPDMPEDEEGVIRVPAIQRFAGSDFSAPVPVSLSLASELDEFAPDIVHAHHPFLLGDTALRISASRNLPVVFTYHTRYELYGHYVAQDSPALQRLVLSLALGYCDLCEAIIAPSESIKVFLKEHGVGTVTVIPTGIEASSFDHGDGKRIRAELGIGPDVFVVGHVGRLAREKNLDYLTDAIGLFLAAHRGAHFLVAGSGDMQEPMRDAFACSGLTDRVHLLGPVEGERLSDVYAAMDVFAFSSHSETQGLVLAEAMTAGVPVVALDAPGAREVVVDGSNGRLLPANASAAQFAEAVEWVAGSSVEDTASLIQAARMTGATYSRPETVRRTLRLYETALEEYFKARSLDDSPWAAARRALGTEWDILRNIASAISGAAVGGK